MRLAALRIVAVGLRDHEDIIQDNLGAALDAVRARQYVRKHDATVDARDVGDHLGAGSAGPRRVL